MGTSWLTRVLRTVADAYGLRFERVNDNIEGPDPGSNVIVFNHSNAPLQHLGDFRGTHMVRDLRDVFVSGYFYHLWTKESWATNEGVAFLRILSRWSGSP